MSTNDQLVADYLGRLATAATVLPGRGEELVDEISAHITEALAVPPAAGGGTSADASADASVVQVLQVLEQLGRPEDIVRAAEDEEPGWGAAPGRSGPARRAGLGILQAGTVVLLLGGGFLIGLGWLAGVALLWTSPRWDTRDKLLGTLIWPGGLAAVLAVPRFGHGQPPVLVLSLLLIGVAGPVLVAIRLLRHARPGPARPAGPAALPTA